MSADGKDLSFDEARRAHDFAHDDPRADGATPVDEGDAEESQPDAPKSRKLFYLHVGAFIFGASLLVFVLSYVGVGQVSEALREVGVGFYLLLLLIGTRHALRAVSLRVSVPREHRHFGFWKAFTTRIGGEAVSFLTFTGPVLGEATKAALLRKRVPLAARVQALVVDNLLYNLSVALFIASGACLLLVAYDLPDAARVPLVLIAVGMALVLALVVAAMVSSMMPFTALVDWLIRRGLKRRFLASRREKVRETESNVYDFYHRRRSAFFLMVACNFLAHATSVTEVWVTLGMFNLEPGAGVAYIIDSLTKVINLVFSFVPATIGVYEGGTGFILGTLGLGAAAGVSLGIVRKAGMIVWAVLGLLALARHTAPAAARSIVERHPRLKKAMDNLVLSNMAHRPARTFVSVLGVAVGVLLVVFTVGLAHGVLRERGRRESEIGAEIMLRASGTTGLTGTQRFALPVARAEEIGRIEGVRIAVPVGQTTSSSDSGFGVRVVDGIRFEEYSRLAGLRMSEGRALQGGDEAIVDPVWKEQRKANVGDPLELFGRTFRIVGVYEPPGGGRIKIPLETVQEQVGSPGQCNTVLVSVNNPAEQEAVAARVREKFPEDQIIFTRDLPELYASGVPALNIFLTVIVAVAAAISMLVILLAMYTTVTERTRQIGVLKALGMSNSSVAWVIEQEALLVSVLGVLLGLALTLGARFLVMRLTSLTVDIEPRWLLISFLIGLAGGTLGALYPALRAARQDPVEALSYE